MIRDLFNKPVWVKRLVITAAIIPFVLAWGEVFTRQLIPQNVDDKMNIFVSNPVIGFNFKPNANAFEKGKEYNAPYHINSLGLRDREYGEKKDGILRILLLGDSFSVSHGLPIENSLSRQMEKALQEVADSEKKSIKFQVINAAAGGYSPYNYLKAYQYWAPVLNPDAVVVGLSPDDYDSGNANMHYFVENGEIMGLYSDGQTPEKDGTSSFKKLRKWLSWNSEFYVLMRNFFYYNDFVAWMTLRQNPGGIEDDSQLQSYMVNQQRKMKNLWSKSFKYLQQLRDATVSDGVALVLIRIPLKMEIDPEQYRMVLDKKGLKKEQIDLNQPLKVISAFCSKENIPVLNPGPALRKCQAHKPCFFLLDGHWNARGVRVASASIAKQWRDLNLMPWATSDGK